MIRSVYTREGNTVKIDKPTVTLGPNSRCEILITLDAIRQETVEEYFEILVRNSDSSLYFQVMAEIQKPRVSLNRNIIKLNTIYAGVQEKVDIDHK